MKYLIYCLIAALIIWSVYYLIRRLYRVFRNINQCDGCDGCGGGCGSCTFDCSGRKERKNRDL